MASEIQLKRVSTGPGTTCIYDIENGRLRWRVHLFEANDESIGKEIFSPNEGILEEQILAWRRLDNFYRDLSNWEESH
jgi:hypothetical protein